MLELHDFPTGRVGPLWLRLFRISPDENACCQSPKHCGATALTGWTNRHRPGWSGPRPIWLAPDPEGARSILGLPEAPTVLCTGHLYKGRGTDLFLGLAEKFPQASFVWVGGRPVDVETGGNGCRAANVTFTGFVPNESIPLYQSAADVC